MIKLAHQAHDYYQIASNALSKLHSVAVLAIRFYIAKVFFYSGLTKLQDWDTTLFLFEEEYQVPLLNFEHAAYLATFGEIVLPVLLFVGLFSRFSALALSAVNIVAVISLIEIAPAALYLHVLWGALLAQVAIYGGGILSLDQLVKKTWLNRTDDK